MAQVHFSVDDDVIRHLKLQAQKAGVSLSKYLSRLVTKHVGEEWPNGYLDEVVGSLSTTPLEEPEDPPPEPVDL